jgi:hypothetical protein
MRAVKVAKLAVDPELRTAVSAVRERRRARKNLLGLDVDTPDLGVEVERGEGTLLAEELEVVNNLISCKESTRDQLCDRTWTLRSA